MRIVLRVDADPDLGSGHFYRCLSLARFAQSAGVQAVVLGDLRSPDLTGLLQAHGVSFHSMPRGRTAAEDALGVREHLLDGDCVVLDRPGMGLDWEVIVRDRGARLTVIDDRPVSPHVADVVVSTALFPEGAAPFDGLVSRETLVLVGPTFMPLRPEFDSPGPALGAERRLTQVGAFFGGSDPGDQIAVVLDVARRARWSEVRFRIVCGGLNQRAEEWMREARTTPNVEVVRTVDDMAAFWRSVALGIGSYGMSAWERCACAVPSVSTVQADDQLDDARGLVRAGAAIDLGWANELCGDVLDAALVTLAASPWQLASMSEAAAQVMRTRAEDSRVLLQAVTGAA